jgi:hypothetical protein
MVATIAGLACIEWPRQPQEYDSWLLSLSSRQLDSAGVAVVSGCRGFRDDSDDSSTAAAGHSVTCVRLGFRGTSRECPPLLRLIE